MPMCGRLPKAMCAFSIGGSRRSSSEARRASKCEGGCTTIPFAWRSEHAIQPFAIGQGVVPAPKANRSAVWVSQCLVYAQRDSARINEGFELRDRDWITRDEELRRRR